MILFRKALILSHRYLGIVLSVMFTMWFVTGIGMIYSRGMPRLTPQVRLARRAPLDLAAVKLTPAQAAKLSGFEDPSGGVSLLSVLGRPAYRFGNSLTVILLSLGGAAVSAIGLIMGVRRMRRSVWS